MLIDFQYASTIAVSSKFAVKR